MSRVLVRVLHSERGAPGPPRPHPFSAHRVHPIMMQHYCTPTEQHSHASEELRVPPSTTVSFVVLVLYEYESSPDLICCCSRPPSSPCIRLLPPHARYEYTRTSAVLVQVSVLCSTEVKVLTEPIPKIAAGVQSLALQPGLQEAEQGPIPGATSRSTTNS